VDQFNSVLEMQVRDLACEFDWIAVPPLRPEAALSAIAAKVWAAARELHDDGALSTPVRIALVINQFPGDTVIVEIQHHLGRRGADNFPVLSECQASDSLQRRAQLQRLHQLECGLLAFSTHDDVEVCAVAEDLVPVICRMDTAVDNRRPWQSLLQ